MYTTPARITDGGIYGKHDGRRGGQKERKKKLPPPTDDYTPSAVVLGPDGRLVNAETKNQKKKKTHRNANTQNARERNYKSRVVIRRRYTFPTIDAPGRPLHGARSHDGLFVAAATGACPIHDVNISPLPPPTGENVLCAFRKRAEKAIRTPSATDARACGVVAGEGPFSGVVWFVRRRRREDLGEFVFSGRFFFFSHR